MKLKTKKKPVTIQAHLLLQALSVRSRAASYKSRVRAHAVLETRSPLVYCVIFIFYFCLLSLQHLISFMHDKGNGLSLDLLTPSSVREILPRPGEFCTDVFLALLLKVPALVPPTQEYLLGLLDIMTRSTDQLISIFNKLSTPVSQLEDLFIMYNCYSETKLLCLMTKKDFASEFDAAISMIR